MKQRLGIAQALMHGPDLIILDEPTTGLDPQGIVDIRELIQKLSKEQGKTVILSSHQLSEIEMIANRLVIINKGKSIIEGNVDELLNSSQMIVKFIVDDPNSFVKLLEKEFSDISGLSIKGNEIEFEVARQLIPLINSFMVKMKLNISAIEQKESLRITLLKWFKIKSCVTERNTYNELIKILAKPRSYIGFWHSLFSLLSFY